LAPGSPDRRAALTAHLDVMRKHDEPAPEPSGPGVYIERAVAA
jgi:hypothetical protein